MNIKALLCFSLLFYLTAYPQYSEEKNVKTDIIGVGVISVTIGGSFPVTGTYSSFITERVDQFISRMYAQALDLSTRMATDPVLYRKTKADLDNFALRGVKLKRSTGEELIVDLQKFRLTGDFTYNPYLRNDDVLIFPTNDISRNFFSVSGAVNLPGTFYFVEGDNLGDALELVGGINLSYEGVDSVELSRLSLDGQTEFRRTIGIDSNYQIQRGDRYRFLALETHRKNFAVSVIGEVNIPGMVPITKNNTTLYEVINSCGGFTPQASLKRARVYSGNSLAKLLENQYNIKLEEQPDLENPSTRNILLNLELALMYRMSNVVTDDTSYFNLENQLRVLIEGSSLDFRKINDPESDIAKYIVQSGDIIIIPQIQNSVYVFGQVLRPGHITFIEGKDYNYYVNEASGLGELAEDDEIMVIKGGSRAWLSPQREIVTIEEGDYIYVPKQSLRTVRSYIMEYSVYLSILASIAAILLSVVTIANN
ncbi:MAG: SLBB domain-containing protein [Ignavibacteriaceae bacterium]|jgi:protein involved in polysaccharide export with SLBB domain|nr:SLBB domain-containing protein [Ignavibacteriaceae bacterium]MCU0405912.1 SLBB domain-containing protein [Ignavibacteriaceae bacterium]MCU0414392.1 SLBB domain-containing protein [Ignavibacteriaceae bacterium]